MLYCKENGIECFMKVLDYRNCMTRPLRPHETRISVIEKQRENLNTKWHYPSIAINIE